MIGELIAKAWVKMAGFTVVHSIPGRLRIHFTGGAKALKVLQQKKEIPDKVFLYKLRGIESFDFNPLTSNALIIYDIKALKGKDILRWLGRTQELIIQSVIKGGKIIDQAAIDSIASQLREEGYVLEKFEQRTTA